MSVIFLDIITYYVYSKYFQTLSINAQISAVWWNSYELHILWFSRLLSPNVPLMKSDTLQTFSYWNLMKSFNDYFCYEQRSFSQVLPIRCFFLIKTFFINFLIIFSCIINDNFDSSIFTSYETDLTLQYYILYLYYCIIKLWMFMHLLKI